MKPFFIVIFIILSFSSYCCPFQARVIKITDGDTITILTDDKRQLKIRLYGIDCPERRQPFGSVATKFTRDAVAGKTVDVEITGKANWGRLTGIVGTLNQDLIEAGLAWVYPEYCKKPFCRQWYRLENEARLARRGLWSAPHVPPWDWRRR